MALSNVWHHRRVADTSAKACWICYKPSTHVLITEDNKARKQLTQSKDWFHICPGHLKDRGFAVPDEEEVKAVEDRKKKEELQKEIEFVKKEYEEKQRLKKEKKKAKNKDKANDKKEDKVDEVKANPNDEDTDEKERDDKIKALSQKEAEVSEPRIYSLKKNFHDIRIQRIRQAEQAKRNRERLKNPSLFPSVPTGDPS
ncbi:DUF1742-domain-containing protein [Patellaria atrata CBS 101060]|uniref:DUF1742-domain-containing protein n=1 Tax=Patellaria atrata CBS 101060 TaxID=1346257 RepID=A0A9P4SDU9_9PEZI|nr:DUF1742-domain-containing protein [Patellaria atrata CBS 101060]